MTREYFRVRSPIAIHPIGLGNIYLLLDIDLKYISVYIRNTSLVYISISAITTKSNLARSLRQLGSLPVTHVPRKEDVWHLIS